MLIVFLKGLPHFRDVLSCSPVKARLAPYPPNVRTAAYNNRCPKMAEPLSHRFTVNVDNPLAQIFCHIA